MRRIALSVLAGVALIGATVVLLRAASASLNPPVVRTSAQLVAVVPAGLTPTAPRQVVSGRSSLQQTLAHLLAAEALFANPGARRPTLPGRSTAIQAAPPVQPLSSHGMACPVATSSSGGGCSIVPCAVYVGAGRASYTVTPGLGLGLAILPSVNPKPSPGNRTPAGNCASRPGRPAQIRRVSSADR